MARKKEELSEVQIDFAERRPSGEPKDFKFLQGLYRSNLKATDEELIKDFVTGWLMEEYIEQDGHIWFKLGKRWTYAILRPRTEGKCAGSNRYADLYYAVF